MNCNIINIFSNRKDKLFSKVYMSENKETRADFLSRSNNIRQFSELNNIIAELKLFDSLVSGTE